VQDNKELSSQLSDLRLQLERLDYDNKERTITIDILKEQNNDLNSELEEVRRQVQEARTSQKDPAAEDREKKKQEKMALMMAKFETVRTRFLTTSNSFINANQSEPLDDEIRSTMSKLENISSGSDLSSLTVEDVTLLRRQLTERSVLLREGLERIRQTQEELDSTKRRRDEAESRLANLETEYEELLGRCIHTLEDNRNRPGFTEKTIHTEQGSDGDVAESMAELKVGGSQACGT
jgi:kinesin family protein 5